MTTYLSPRYGSYSYPSGTQFRSMSDGLGAKLRVADTPSVDGQFTAGGLLASRKFSVKGTLALLAPTGVVATDAAAFRTLRDAFYAAHAPGSPQAFWIDDDRYLLAEVESTALQEWSKGMPYSAFEVGFVAADPYSYQGSAYAAASNSYNLTVGGASPPPSNTSQIANPVTAPTVTAAAAATALLAGTYEVAYTWRDGFGETQISTLGTVTIAATNKIHVAALALPSGVTSANLYASIAAASTTLAWVQTWNGTATDITALPVSPNATSVTPAGTAYSLPIFTIPVTAAPAGGLIYGAVTDGTTVWGFTLAPTVTGTYIVDAGRQRQRVTLAGVDTTSIFRGKFPRLAAAANTITLGVSGGAAIVGATVGWQDRWFNV